MSSAALSGIDMNLFAPLLIGALLLTGPNLRDVSPAERVARELVANFNGSRFQAAAKDFNSDLAAIVTPAVLAAQDFGRCGRLNSLR